LTVEEFIDLLPEWRACGRATAAVRTEVPHAHEPRSLATRCAVA